MRVGQPVRLTVEGDATVLRRPRRAARARHPGAEPHAAGRGRGAQRARRAAARLVRAGRDRRPRPRSPVVLVPASAHRDLRGHREGDLVEEGKAVEKRVDDRPARAGERVEIVSTGSTAGEPWCSSPATSRAASPSRAVPLGDAEARRNLHPPPGLRSMLILALVVVGAASYFRLGVDRFPSVDLPTVARAHEPARRLARGGRDRRSRSRSRRSSTRSRASASCARSRAPATRVVIATFDLDRDIDVAAQDVRDRVADRAPPSCPRDIRPPDRSRSSTTTPRRC